RRMARCDVCCRNKITEWSKTALKREGGFFDGLRIEANATQLHEIPSVRAWSIDETHVSILDNLPATQEIVGRKPKFHRKNVDRAHRKNAQCSLGASDSVCHLIHRSVATSCNYPSKTFLDGTSRERFRFPCVRSDANRQTTDD